MSLYEYQCPRCGTTRDVRVALDELETIMVVCHGPNCDVHMKRAIPKINIIFEWKERIMDNWINSFLGGEMLETVDPFEALEIKATPTTLLHIRESSIQGVIKFKKLSLEAKVPTRKFSGDAGLDVYALETTYIAARFQAVMRTGIALAGAPDNCVIQVWSKSGLDANLCLHVGAGIIDPNYRGEILVLLKNTGWDSVGINKGDAIAQLVIVPCMRPEIEIVKEVETTDRGEQGGINDHTSRG